MHQCFWELCPQERDWAACLGESSAVREAAAGAGCQGHLVNKVELSQHQKETLFQLNIPRKALIHANPGMSPGSKPEAQKPNPTDFPTATVC